MVTQLQFEKARNRKFQLGEICNPGDMSSG